MGSRPLILSLLRVKLASHIYLPSDSWSRRPEPEGPLGYRQRRTASQPPPPWAMQGARRCAWKVLERVPTEALTGSQRPAWDMWLACRMCSWLSPGAGSSPLPGTSKCWLLCGRIQQDLQQHFGCKFSVQSSSCWYLVLRLSIINVNISTHHVALGVLRKIEPRNLQDGDKS